MYLLLLVLLSLAGLESSYMWILHTISIHFRLNYYKINQKSKKKFSSIEWREFLFHEQSQLYIILEKSRLIKSCLLMKKFPTPQSPHIIAIRFSSKSSEANWNSKVS